MAEIALLWHFHQPDYRDPVTGRPVMPWTRMHMLRGYRDVVLDTVDSGVAVTINRPFINGEYFSIVRGHELPEWASEFDCDSWAQFSLKFILSHPAVNCVLTETANPKHAVAYHFQNDADTLPGVMAAVQQVYDGPVDYAQDFMVWNITKDGVRTRMAVPNPEAYPTPPLAEKVVDKSNPYKQPEWIAEGWPEEVTPVVEQIYEDANQAFGTNLEPN